MRAETSDTPARHDGEAAAMAALQRFRECNQAG
jgi:hypothetical protein